MRRPMSRPGRARVRYSRLQSTNHASQQHDQHGEEQEVVAVRQRLNQPGERKHRQPPALALVQERVHAEQRQRHPLRREDLQVRQLPRTVGSEPIGQPGAARRDHDRTPRRMRDRPGAAPAGMQRTPTARTRGSARRCTPSGDWRRAAAAVSRRRRCRPDVPRARARLGHRMENRRAPPAVRERHRLRVPPEQPGVENGVAGIVRHARREVRREGPGPEHGERQEGDERSERAPAHAAPE